METLPPRSLQLDKKGKGWEKNEVLLSSFYNWKLRHREIDLPEVIDEACGRQGIKSMFPRVPVQYFNHRPLIHSVKPLCCKGLCEHYTFECCREAHVLPTWRCSLSTKFRLAASRKRRKGQGPGSASLLHFWGSSCR